MNIVGPLLYDTLIPILIAVVTMYRPMLLPDLSALLSLKPQPLKPVEVRQTLMRGTGDDAGRVTSLLNAGYSSCSSSSNGYWTRRNSRITYRHARTTTQQADNKFRLSDYDTTDSGTL